MTQYSYSRVSLFNNCPYHFKLRYIDQLTELPRYDADNPLIIGHALHTGIEHDVDTALNAYYRSFPVLTDAIVVEAMKLEILIPKVKDFLERYYGDCELIHEYKLDFPNYVGFVDLIIRSPNGKCTVIDFKYSNNIDNYLNSGQLHIYKDYLTQDGFNITHLNYLFVPKRNMKQKENEDLFHYRRRIVRAVEDSSLQLIPIKFDEMETIYFLNSIKKIEAAKDYPKNTSGKCFSCNPKFAPNYLELITDEKGDVEMALPKNERREKMIDTKPDFWIYGDSYVGKSTFVDGIENVLFLNTDGNTDNTTAPVVAIKDQVSIEGRRTNRTFAWEVFLNTIHDLETEKNSYEAVAIDLIEDLKEHCRYYVFEKNGWEHESDGSYGKGWAKVTTEWQKAIKRLKSLGYQLIYISKEKLEEITLKGGAKRTTFKPNIDDKFANFLTGTVDLTMHAFVNSDGERLLQLGKKNNVFGGGRFDFQVEQCELSVDAFVEELTAAQAEKSPRKKEKAQHKPAVSKESEVEEPTEEKVTRWSKTAAKETETEEKPKRTRKKRETVENDDVPPGEEPPEEKPTRTRRTRKTRGEE